MRRWALYGGTFDPFHLAHEAVSIGLLRSGLYERVFIMTSGDSPHKSMSGRPPAVMRYAMAHLNLSEHMARDKRLILSDWEILQEGPSYTVKTLEFLQELDENVELSLIGGSDILHEILGWYKPDRIMELARLAIIHRPGYEDEKDHRQAELLRQENGARIIFVPIPTPEVSSSEIRTQIASGIDPHALPLHPKVADFIDAYALYQEDRKPWDLRDENVWRMLWQEKGWREVLRTFEPHTTIPENLYASDSYILDVKGN